MSKLSCTTSNCSIPVWVWRGMPERERSVQFVIIRTQLNHSLARHLPVDAYSRLLASFICFYAYHHYLLIFVSRVFNAFLPAMVRAVVFSLNTILTSSISPSRSCNITVAP